MFRYIVSGFLFGIAGGLIYYSNEVKERMMRYVVTLVNNRRDYSVKDTSTNTEVILSRICPHAGCEVDYKEGQAEFECPCHGSKFDMDGNVISGPSEENLDKKTQ